MGVPFFPSFLSKFKHTVNKTTEDTIKVFSFSSAIVLFTEVRIKFSSSLTHSMRQQRPREHTRAFSPGLKDDQVLGTGLRVSGAFSHLILTATPQSLGIRPGNWVAECRESLPGITRQQAGDGALSAGRQPAPAAGGARS